MAGSGLDQQVARALLRVLDAEDRNYSAAADARFALSDAPPGVAEPGGPHRLGPTGTTDGS